MVVTFHGQVSGAFSGCCAEPRLRPCRRWRTTPQLRLFPRPARPRCRDTPVGVAVAVSSGRLARHLLFGRLVVASSGQRVCAALPCHSVALSARCACHSVASSGASMIQRGSGAIKEVGGTGGQHGGQGQLAYP